MRRFTVLTATYQRGTTLPRLMRSLEGQTLQDYEWLVVDDGSTDDTKDLVAAFASRAPFPVRYQWQEHRGKHVAFNAGVRMAEGALLIDVGSDDELDPLALERLAHHWEAIPAAEREHHAGLLSLCRRPSGEVVGDRFPRDGMDSDHLELRYRLHVRGDHVGMFRTDVLRAYPLPEPDGVTYVPESLLFDQIAATHHLRCVNEALYIVHTGAANRLTRRAARREQAPGLWRLHAHNLGFARDWIRHAPLSFLKTGVNYSRFSLHLRLGPRAWWQQAPGPLARALALVGVPAGVLLWLDDHRRARLEAHGRGG